MKIAIIFTLISINLLLPQNNMFDEKQFFMDIKNSYYNLNNTNLENSTALVTSLKMEKFAKEIWNTEEIFPIQLIWFKPNRLYIAQQGIPTITENRYEEYQDLVEGIKQQVKSILIDFERFYITGLYESIKDDYTITTQNEFVWIEFNTGTIDQEVPVKYTMGKNGLCIKIEIYYPNENKKLIINPKFKIIKTKWICTGWQVQTLINEKPMSGFMLEIRYDQYQSNWIPTQITITVQKANEPAITYYDVIKLKSYMFNQPIELQEGIINPNH